MHFQRVTPCVAMAGLLACAALGCASAGIQTSKLYVPEDEVVKPSVVLVYDFRFSAADVSIDDRVFGGKKPTQAEKDRLGREVSAGFAKALVEKLGEAGIEAQRADSRTSTPLHAWLVKGRFLSVDEGSRAKRVALGFGAGATELEVKVEVFQVTDSGQRKLSEGEAKASGSKMPGMAVPVAGGAAMGTALTSAAISGTLAVTREVRGSLGADANRLAEALAERAKAFYQRRGWL